MYNSIKMIYSISKLISNVFQKECTFKIKVVQRSLHPLQMCDRYELLGRRLWSTSWMHNSHFMAKEKNFFLRRSLWPIGELWCQWLLTTRCSWWVHEQPLCHAIVLQSWMWLSIRLQAWRQRRKLLSWKLRIHNLNVRVFYCVRV